ncbi:MAG: hypothetical protein IJ323_03105 [Clostridia bacterium]|nr:hypothetical protein [Clostridia bacterium]
MPAFTNQATLTFNDTQTNSNIVTGNITEALSASKNAVVSTYTRGDTITYVINIVNSSQVAYNALALNDDLGAYPFGTGTLTPLTYIEGSLNYYVNGVLQPTPAVTTDDGLTVSGINVPAGGNALIIYEAEANSFAPLGVGDSITNTATISGEALIEPITVTETVTPEASPQLSITKSLSPTTVFENGEITYTFVIQNTGNTPTVATDSLTVTDTFDPILRNITVTYNGEALTEGTDYTYENGVFTTVNGVITVPAATYTRDPATGNLVITPGVSVLTVTGTV